MTTTISGTSGIQTPSLDLTTPLPVTEGGTGTSTVKPYRMVLGTPITTTSGTSHDFTSIPSWVKRITVMFNGVSTNGSSLIQIRLGTSGGIEATGYIGSGSFWGASSSYTQLSTGFTDGHSSSTNIRTTTYVFTLSGVNTWTCIGFGGLEEVAYHHGCGGRKTLSGTIDRLRLTTVNGTDTFDAGSFNIMYEGYED